MPASAATSVVDEYVRRCTERRLEPYFPFIADARIGVIDVDAEFVLEEAWILFVSALRSSTSASYRRIRVALGENFGPRHPPKQSRRIVPFDAIAAQRAPRSPPAQLVPRIVAGLAHQASMSGVALTEFRLFGIRVGPEGAARLATGLQACMGLRALQLDGCDIGNSGFQELVNALRRLPQLESVSLKRAALTNAAADDIARLVSGNVTSRHWEETLRRNEARGNDGPEALTSLSLADNPISDAVVHAILRQEPARASLEFLDLSGTSVSRDAASALMNTIAAADTVIKTVRLSRTPAAQYFVDTGGTGDSRVRVETVDCGSSECSLRRVTTEAARRTAQGGAGRQRSRSPTRAKEHRSRSRPDALEIGEVDAAACQPSATTSALPSPAAFAQPQSAPVYPAQAPAASAREAALEAALGMYQRRVAELEGAMLLGPHHGFGGGAPPLGRATSAASLTAVLRARRAAAERHGATHDRTTASGEADADAPVSLAALENDDDDDDGAAAAAAPNAPETNNDDRQAQDRQANGGAERTTLRGADPVLAHGEVAAAVKEEVDAALEGAEEDRARLVEDIARYVSAALEELQETTIGNTLRLERQLSDQAAVVRRLEDKLSDVCTSHAASFTELASRTRDSASANDRAALREPRVIVIPEADRAFDDDRATEQGLQQCIQRVLDRVQMSLGVDKSQPDASKSAASAFDKKTASLEGAARSGSAQGAPEKATTTDADLVRSRIAVLGW